MQSGTEQMQITVHRDFHTELDVLAVLPTPLSAGFLTCHQVNLAAHGWGLSPFLELSFPVFLMVTSCVCFPFIQWQCQTVQCQVLCFHLWKSPTLYQNILRTGPPEKVMGTSAPCFRVSFKPMMNIIKSNYKKYCSLGMTHLLFPLFSQGCWIWEVLSTL